MRCPGYLSDRAILNFVQWARCGHHLPTSSMLYWPIPSLRYSRCGILSSAGGARNSATGALHSLRGEGWTHGAETLHAHLRLSESAPLRARIRSSTELSSGFSPYCTVEFRTAWTA